MTKVMASQSNIAVVAKTFPPTSFHQKIFVLQSSQTRALNVGFMQKFNSKLSFVPARLHFGPLRAEDTFQATVQSLQLPEIKKIIHAYPPDQISTITILRETLACRLGDALVANGITNHFGDAFVGATHIKGDGEIKTAYLYENIEGLAPHGLWILADSICMGRNTCTTLSSLLAKFKPREIIVLAPIASRRGIDIVGSAIARYNIPASFVAWGALFGVDERTLYDMPWGHPDTEPLDRRDQKLVVNMYGPNLCMGGDFGNNYYCPPLAKKLYEEQLKEHKIKPDFPTAYEVLKTYNKDEILIRQST